MNLKAPLSKLALSALIKDYNSFESTLCNQLFSRKTRFHASPGLYADWETLKLENIFDAIKGNGLSKEKLASNGKYKCILYGELYTKYSEVIIEVISKTNVAEGAKSQFGDLLIPSSTTTTGIDLANVSTILENDILLGGDITILRSKGKINSMFYAYYLTNFKKNELASFSQGSTIVHLYYNHFKEMSIDVPDYEEQTKIAETLYCLDEKRKLELQLLKSYESQKSYIMSKLFI